MARIHSAYDQLPLRFFEDLVPSLRIRASVRIETTGLEALDEKLLHAGMQHLERRGEGFRHHRDAAIAIGKVTGGNSGLD